jgi:uncharacterized protein (TIGR02145 family)
MKKVFFLATIFLILETALHAQVTIGKAEEPEKGVILDLNPKNVLHGGLLLPNVSISNVDSIPVDLIGTFTKDERDNYPNLRGLLVYNTNENTVGGNGEGIYSWDGGKWCNEGSNFTITSDATSTTINASGGSISCTVTDPACRTAGVYTFNYITGEEYSQLDITDAGAGAFTLTLAANDRAALRTVILIVTSPCGKSQTLFYTQEGDYSGCENPASNPVVKAEDNHTTLCSGGAVYLYLEKTPEGKAPEGNYIWTLNGEEVGTGTQLVATRTGKYIVYANKIGCTTHTPGEITVVASLGSAGSPEELFLIAKNDGLVCSSDATTKLFASRAGDPATIVWYKNGERTNHTGRSIDAEIGTWFAVVKDGTCISRPSNSVTVQPDPNSGHSGINDFSVTVNGVPLSDAMNLCGGGSLNLAVTSPQSEVDYIWYNNNTVIGLGDSITYSMPEITGSFILRCRATLAGSCSVEKLTEATIDVNSPPRRPYITVSNPGDALCGGTAVLTANVSEAVSSFIWYYSEDNSLYRQLTETTQTLSIERIGYYKVAAVKATCVSEQSVEKNIALNSALTGVWIIAPTGVINPGDSRTYTAQLDNPQGAHYAWSVVGNATIQGQADGSSVVINFTTDGKATISVNAENACGDALPKPATLEVTVADACSPANVSPQLGNNTTINKMTGETLSLSVIAGGSPNLSYQWYKDNAQINGETASTYTKNNITESEKGTYYCIVKTDCGSGTTARSGNFEVDVRKNPSQMELGTGSLTGRTNFDIAVTTSTSCLPTSSRQSSNTKADFANLPSADKTYTFTAKSSVSNVRFMVIDDEGCVDSTSTTPNGNGAIAGGVPVKLTVNYKKTLNQISSVPLIRGRNRNAAAVVMIYAVYNDGTKDVSVPLRVKIQDCAFCGAKVADNTWKEFMCHNLGADTSVDPFTPSYATNGAYYQFGRKNPAKSAPNSNGADVTTITWSSTVPPGYFGDNSNGKDVKVKSATDPCPVGFRIPSYDEWNYLKNNNPTSNQPGNTSWVNSSTCNDCWRGKKFGDALMLPAAGSRSSSRNGSLRNRGMKGDYWSTALYDSSGAYSMGSTSFISSMGIVGREEAISIRCIAE